MPNRTMPQRPDRPALTIGESATVTIRYADLVSLQRYAEQLSGYIDRLELDERNRVQLAVAGDPAKLQTIAAALRASGKAISFLIANVHPSTPEGAHLPADDLRAFAAGLRGFFGAGTAEATLAQLADEHADLADEYNGYRLAQTRSWASPCKVCGCPRDVHAVVLKDCGECPDPRYPDVRRQCSAHPECERFEPSVPLPPMPGL